MTRKIATDETATDDYVDPRIIRTRSAVIDAAGELLLADGPDAVTHARVAEATSYSRTTLYKYWPQRSDLLRAGMEKIGKQKMTVDHLTGDLRIDLRSLLDGLVRDLGNDVTAKLMITMLERAQHDASVAEVRRALVAEIAPAFGSVFATAIEAGDLRPDLDVDLAIASLAGSLFFLRFLADEPITVDTADRIVDDFVRSHAPT